MDKEFKTTFIPKKNLAGAKKSESSRSKAQKSLLGLIALLLFITSAVSIAGVFLYKIRIASLLNSRIDSINRAEKAFEPAVIVELKKLDVRLQAGAQLLENHIAISDFLKSLAESTLPDVSFADFSFSYVPDGSEIAISGEARGYLQIAQQSDVFEDNIYIQNHIFSDFSLTDTGRITFSLQFTLNPALMSFGRLTEANQTPTGDLPEGTIIPDANQTPEGTNINFNSPFGGATN
jgi:hypothetical protein